MASAGILCTDVHVKAKVKNLSADIDSGDFVETDVWIADAEGLICTIGRYDFVTNYATLNAKAKMLLRQICSDLVALNCITYDMSGFTSRVEAEDMINIYRDAALRGLAIIRDWKARDYIVNE